MTEIILTIIAGLVLFLYAVNSLSDIIQKALGKNAEKWILRFTSNTFFAILTGIVVTTLLDSSSAVIIITIVFVNSKLMTFRQSMGVVLGANIGTTVSSQILAMDISKYSPVLLLAGFLLLFVSKTGKMGNTAKTIMYFGVLFFGLFTMEKAVEPLRESEKFTHLMASTENPLAGALTGAIVTLVIQSSSATVGMAIILAKKGLLGLGGAIAIMLGAELGTCSDTLIATIRGSREALKTGLFHLCFNIASIALGLVFFRQFVEFIRWIGGNAPIERSVANAHMLFNVGGVLIFVWALPVFERALNTLVKPRQQADELASVAG